MSRRKYILKRPKNKELEAKEIEETLSRMRGYGLKLTKSREVERYGKNYFKMIFEIPNTDDE
jgi:hypothetical protein